MYRMAIAAILAAGALASVPARGEEIGRSGETVIARVERPGGDRYEITVTPPPDRGVDRRVMEWLTDTGVADADAADEDRVDMSDYRVRVERLASPSCTGQFNLKSKPVNLGAKKAWVVESDTATYLSATAFPTKGDVDVFVFVGPTHDVCAKSTKKKQNMDHAGCVRQICVTPGISTNVRVEVANLTTAPATAVAVFELVFVTLP